MYVYVISAGPMAQKIGISAKATVRLTNLQVAHHTDLTLTHMTLVDDARSVERYAHALLATKRLRGEWFEVSPEEARSTVERARSAIQSGMVAPHRYEEPDDGPTAGLAVREPEVEEGGYCATSTVERAARRRAVNSELYRRLVAPARA